MKELKDVDSWDLTADQSHLTLSCGYCSWYGSNPFELNMVSNDIVCEEDNDVLFGSVFTVHVVSKHVITLSENASFQWYLYSFAFSEVAFQVTLIAQGDVPLSIVMTVCTTLGAVLLTPLLTKILAGTYVPVDAIKLSISTLQVNTILSLSGHQPTSSV